MSLYVRVDINFYTHRKTMRLKAALGEAAYWIPPRLWAYAALNQPDGCFSSYTFGELACAIGYTGDASSMLQALLQAGFLDKDLKIHGWEEHNGYHKVFADRAKKAAEARWEKERTKERQKAVQEGRREETSIASSMLEASPPVPVFDKELNGRIKLAEEEVNRIKLKGALSDDDKAEIKTLREKQTGWRKQILGRK